MPPLISVITPSFNQGPFIERTLQSVLSQNIKNYEYIIMDGGSTDETISILKCYNNKLKWISEPDKGQSHAVNKGIQQTDGEIIAWLNSDDIYYPRTLETVARFFSAYPEYDVLYGDANHIDENDGIIEKYDTHPWDTELLRNICYLCQPATFFRRSVLERFGALDETLQYCMDYELWLRLSQHNVRFYYLNQTLAGSRLHKQTKTLGSRLRVHKEINDMFRQKFSTVPHRWIVNYAHVYIEEKKGLNRNDWRFYFLVAFLSLTASLRWNKKISFSLLQNGFDWFMHGFKMMRTKREKT